MGRGIGPTRNKNAFVTGGTGFLGRNLVEQLREQGWGVTCMHRGTSDTRYLERLGVALVEADLLEPEAVLDAMPEGVDAVFHVAGNTSMWSRHADLQMKVNVDGTRHVLRAAEKRHAKRFVHTSSWCAYGDHGRTPLTEETDKLGGVSGIPYDKSKYLGELCALRANGRGLPVVVLNPAHMLGRYDRKGWAQMIIRAARGRLFAVPSGSGVFCHAEAVAKAHVAAAERGDPGANYLLGGPEASFADLARLLGELLGMDVPDRTVPPSVLTLIGHVQAAVASITGRQPSMTPQGAAVVNRHGRIASTKAERELGYWCPDLRTQLRDAIAWLSREELIDHPPRSWTRGISRAPREPCG